MGVKRRAPVPPRKRAAPRAGARRKKAVTRLTRAAGAIEIAEIESLRAELDRLGASAPPRWNADPEDVRRSVAKLVLTLIEFIRQILERQAIRRMDASTLTPAETEGWGLWNGVEPDAESTLATAQSYARNLCSTAGRNAVAMAKRQVYDDLLSTDVGASVVESKRLLDVSMRTAEYREGVAALSEKRLPRFD